LAGTAVQFDVSSVKTAHSAQNSPDHADTLRPERYALTHHRIDGHGVITQAKGENGELIAGAQMVTPGPDAPGPLITFGAMFVVGWVVALIRRQLDGDCRQA